jgi:hypothetical protein
VFCASLWFFFLIYSISLVLFNIFDFHL